MFVNDFLVLFQKCVLNIRIWKADDVLQIIWQGNSSDHNIKINWKRCFEIFRSRTSHILGAWALNIFCRFGHQISKWSIRISFTVVWIVLLFLHPQYARCFSPITFQYCHWKHVYKNVNLHVFLKGAEVWSLKDFHLQMDQSRVCYCLDLSLCIEWCAPALVYYHNSGSDCGFEEFVSSVKLETTRAIW